MCNIIQKYKDNVSNYKNMTKEMLDEKTYDNWYKTILMVVELNSVFGMSSTRIYKDSYRYYGLDNETILQEIIKRFQNDGFVVNFDSLGIPLFKLSFIEISLPE